MSTAVMMKTVNLKEYLGRLKKLEEAVAAESLEAAARAGALIVQNAAKEKCPKRTRTLSRSIHMETAEKSRFKVTVDIGTDLVYAPVHEFGAVITPKRARMLAFHIDGRLVFAHAVHIPARPYMRPALEENEARVVAEVEKVLGQLVGQVAK